MVGSFPVAIVAGLVFGFLAGLGIGGGSLLMMWLTLIVGMEPFSARCINLLFFIPCAICSSIFRWRQGDLPIKKLIAPIIVGAILAGVFSYFSAMLDTQALQKVFGGLLILTGLREIFYQPKR